jgi:hypothetical protein
MQAELAEWLRAARRGPIFSDENIQLKKGKRIDSMKTMLRGRIDLFIDRLEFRDVRKPGNEAIIFPLDTIEAEGVLKWNFFEFYQAMNVYRVVFKDPKASGRKYADALGLLHELSRSHLPGR